MIRNSRLFYTLLGLFTIMVLSVGCSRVNREAYLDDTTLSEAKENELEENGLKENELEHDEDENIQPEEEQIDEAIQNLESIGSAENSSGIPSLHIVYRQGETVKYESIQSGDYEWTTVKPDGQNESVIACGSHPTDMVGKVAEIVNEEGLDFIRFVFSNKPDSYKLVRYKTNTDEMDQFGETIELDGDNSDRLLINKENSGYIYQVNATWENGSINYYFYISNQE